MLDWNQCPAVESLSRDGRGVWVFRGTRVPVKTLFENLGAGARLVRFLEWFPDVSREQAEQVLLHAERSLAACDPELHADCDTDQVHAFFAPRARS